MGLTTMLSGPLVFTPYLRPQVWGGQRLQTMFGKCAGLDERPVGESWELSGHPHHISRVSMGPASGQSLNEIWQAFSRWTEFPETLQQSNRFPWLIKFLDCTQNLSIQVHPDDGHARRMNVDEVGKTEAWYVLHAEPGSSLYLGWRKPCSPEEVRQRIQNGTLADALQRIEPRPGDAFLVPAGTVHAIGGGIVLLEVQQTSDATFRLFDWDRRDSDGTARPLHVEQALACLDWSVRSLRPTRGMPILGLPDGVGARRLLACDYFQMDEFRMRAAQWQIPHFPLSVWILIEGNCELVSDRTSFGHFHAGQTIFLPSSGEAFHWRKTAGPRATFVRITPPCDTGVWSIARFADEFVDATAIESEM